MDKIVKQISHVLCQDTLLICVDQTPSLNRLQLWEHGRLQYQRRKDFFSMGNIVSRSPEITFLFSIFIRN